MEKIKKMLAYWLIIIFAFYILPLLTIYTASSMFIVLIGIPVICFTISLIYGKRNSFDWLFSIFVMLAFIPSIFIFYNESVAIYTLVYGSLSVIGQFIGHLMGTKN
ncbi:hypothetical protein [uncultured Ezakiella sp.]|uniref:hypothetical protein n=1 Tax=uncultured Ezakiella sp. TaxID=1637529 RepID=UPI0025E9531C|nr:hypothetical protein [uncultured Ezakiella sp.]